MTCKFELRLPSFDRPCVVSDGDTSATGRRPVDEMVKPRPPVNTQPAGGSSSSNVTAMKDREDFENQVLATSSAALKTTVVRPGFVYGGQGGFVADLFYSEPLVIQGRRDMRWSWVHVDDLAEGYVAIGRAPRVIVDKQRTLLSSYKHPVMVATTAFVSSVQFGCS